MSDEITLKPNQAYGIKNILLKRNPTAIVLNDKGRLKLIYGTETYKELECFSNGGNLYVACNYNQASEDGKPYISSDIRMAKIAEKMWNENLNECNIPEYLKNTSFVKFPYIKHW